MTVSSHQATMTSPELKDRDFRRIKEFLYKTSDYYAPEYERTIQWNDSTLAIDWPIDGLDVRLSDKDKNGAEFTNAEIFD